MLSPRPDLCLNHKMVFLTPSWILSAAILFFTTLVLAYFYMTRNFNHWKNKGVTEVTPIPFVGNFGQCLLFRLSVFEYLAEIYKWGQGLPYVGFYIFDKPALVLRDPEVIKSVLLKDFQNLPNRYGTASSKDFVGNNNLFLIKNPDWKNLRYKLTSVFSSGKMKAMFPLVNAVGDDLATYFEHLNLEGEGQVLELKEICAKYTTDVIGTCVYGLQVNSLANPNAEFRKYGRRMFDFTWKRGAEMMAIFFIPGITNFFGSTLFEGESSNFMKKVFWETLTTRMRTGLKRNDLIDLLIELRNNQTDDDLFQFTDENMVAQAAVFFAAGFETSSTLVSFTLHELSLQPELQTKLREEILTALEESDGKLSYDLVHNLPYLAKVAWETLRKYPSVPFLDREAICDYTIPKTGLLIKKGTPVYTPLLGLHYDPEYYPDPVKYDPERFSEENKKKRPAFTYLPFGEGPRNCIGLRFGLMQAKIGLVKILSKFEVSPCNKTLNPMRVDPKALTYSSDGGLFHRVRRITTTAGCKIRLMFSLVTEVGNNPDNHLHGLIAEDMAFFVPIWLVNCAIIFLSILATSYFYMTRNFNYWKKKNIVEKKPLPFFGNYFPCFALQTSPGDFLKDLHAEHNSVNQLGFYIFDKPCLLVRDLELVNRILVKDFNAFCDRYSGSNSDDPLGVANLFTLQNPHWKTVRTKLSPTFTSGKLKQMLQLMVKVGKDLDRYFETLKLEGEGRVIELREVVARYTTDVIATCAYGIEANCLNNPNAEFRKCGKKIFNDSYKRAFEFRSFFFTPGITKLFGMQFFERTSSEFLRKVLWDTLTQRMKNGIHRNDLIDTLIQLKNGQTEASLNDDDSFKFDGDNLTAQAAIYFTGGSETTLLTIAFTLYELALQPDIQSRLREEITSALEENGGNIDYEWVMRLPYLGMVVSETLRKYPVVPFLDRVVNTDYKIPGSDTVLEKHTPIFISVFGFHHDPEYFPDPEKYDPERFSNENKQTRPSRAYMPFGDGPHNCIGLRFALASLKLGLIKIVSKYKLFPSKDTVIPLRLNPRSFFTTMDHDLFLKVQKIDD
ncbi:uncharacterized protein LOC107216955 [Neodiprion lecontei]|uniref:Uncharacterized protein LOC107216955 n=1 Tax=Neodiprion lecontei TaxID=441921 RepID=A0ABM3G0Z5_NEOLC|nr:uncharacterized protein LOC107216955 [Neodiprion lecontei]